jgi:hypothetical protein
VQIEAAEPAPVGAGVEPSSTGVNARPVPLSIDAIRVEITETVTVVVPGQSENPDEVLEVTGSEPAHPIAAPNLKRDEATAALDDGE